MTINKLSRSDAYTAHKAALSKRKSALRKERAKIEEQDPTLRVKRQAANIPITIDDKRLYDPSREGIKGQAIQSQTSIPNNIQIKTEDESSSPKVLITTSKNPTKISWHFMAFLNSILPSSTTLKRLNNYSITEIHKLSKKRGYTHLLVINEDRKKVNALTILTDSEELYFTISSLELRSQAAMTTHVPELIMQNFTTDLGKGVASIFSSLIPKAQINGRQVLTFHNSRDFIFVRRYRYLFAGAGDKTRVQEIGPRFTLKLRTLKRDGTIVFESNASVESDRKALFL